MEFTSMDLLAQNSGVHGQHFEGMIILDFQNDLPFLSFQTALYASLCFFPHEPPSLASLGEFIMPYLIKIVNVPSYTC